MTSANGADFDCGTEFSQWYGTVAVRNSANRAERLQYGMHSGGGTNSANGTERLRYEFRLLRYEIDSVNGTSTEFGRQYGAFAV